MAGKGRILIPGLYDSSEESENDDVGPPADDIAVNPETPETCGEEAVVEQDDQDDFDSASVETAEEREDEQLQQEEEEEEEEEEYDPTAPFMKLQRPAVSAHAGTSSADEEPMQQSGDEAAPVLDRQGMGDLENEEEADQDNNYFVVDVHNRCIKILPGGYDEREFTTLEKIPAETFAMLNERVHSPNSDDDDHFYCVTCVMSFRICCPRHPLYRILDRPVSHPIDDRAKKTLPAFIRIKNSSIPNAGMGAFTITELPVGMVFGPYQGILSKEEDTLGYSWEIRNVDAPSMFLDGSDPKYSNWMRYINSPRYDREQNLVAFQYNGSVFYRVIKPIDCDQELLVWYGAKYGESLGVFKTKKSSTKSRPVAVADVKNPFIM